MIFNPFKNCPSETNSVACDFEESQCGYEPDGSIYYNDWIRTNGSLTGSNIIDHTLGTSFGYYMYASQETNDSYTNIARLQSVQITDLNVKCLSFFFNMNGEGAFAQYNQLSVYIKQSGSYIIWSTYDEDIVEGPNSVR